MLAAVAVAITACTYAPGPGRYRLPDPYLIAADFDAKQAQDMLRPGENSIRGSALIRQSGGGVVTCAGGTVSLIPATQYANERTAGQFPAMHDERGFSRKIYLQFDPDERAYAQLMRHTSCDAQGAWIVNLGQRNAHEHGPPDLRAIAQDGAVRIDTRERGFRTCSYVTGTKFSAKLDWHSHQPCFAKVARRAPAGPAKRDHANP